MRRRVRGYITVSAFRAALAALALCALSFVFGGGAQSAAAAQLPDTLEKVKPAIVGIGTYQQARSPRTRFLGTGFVVADGRHVITNEHVIPELIDTQKREFIAVIIAGPRGRRMRRRANTLPPTRRAIWPCCGSTAIRCRR